MATEQSISLEASSKNGPPKPKVSGGPSGQQSCCSADRGPIARNYKELVARTRDVSGRKAESEGYDLTLGFT